MEEPATANFSSEDVGACKLVDPDEVAARSCSRWLLPTEALMTQGFPVHPVYHQQYRICSFNFARDTPRKPRSVCAQAGNSMNVICPYLCILHSAVCWRPTTHGNRTGQQTLPTITFYVSLVDVYHISSSPVCSLILWPNSRNLFERMG